MSCMGIWFISPTILSNNTLTFKKGSDFHPSGNTYIYIYIYTHIHNIQHIYVSENIVGEIMVKTPYEFQGGEQTVMFGGTWKGVEL